MFRQLLAGCALLGAVALAAPVLAQGSAAEQERRTKLDLLYDRLATADESNWERIQDQIYGLWLQSGSATMDLLLARARVAMEAEDYETALLHLDDLVRLAPDFAEGWNSRATVHFLREDYGRSLHDIYRTLSLEPRHFGALAGLGIILDRMDEDEWALRVYRRVQELHPNMPGSAEGIRHLEPRVDGRRL